MKYLQSQLVSMRSRSITSNEAIGYPSSSYPNSDTYAYHDFYEAELFIEGSGIHYINGIPYHVKPGYFYLLYPGDCHRMELDCEVHYELKNLKFAVNIPQNEIMGEISSYHGPYSVYLDEKSTALIGAELKSLADNSDISLLMMKNIVDRVCITLLNALEKGRNTDKMSSAATSSDQRIHIITEYIEKNYHREISLSEISAHVKLSENYFGIFFKKQTGMNFREFVNHRRVSHVIRLLTATGMPLKEIAFRTGFCSAEYMAKIFREYCGMTPGEYRKLNRT